MKVRAGACAQTTYSAEAWTVGGAGSLPLKWQPRQKTMQQMAANATKA